ncbi:Kinectin, partial [Bienertia sinuspersici]
QAKTNTRISASTSSILSTNNNTTIAIREEKLKHTEDSIKNVMLLNCWGPN